MSSKFKSAEIEQRYDAVVRLTSCGQVMEMGFDVGIEGVAEAMLYAAVCVYGNETAIPSVIHDRLILDGTYDRIMTEVRDIIREKCANEWRRVKQAN